MITRMGIGLMSGTSLDGMDAALVEIEGTGTDTRIRLLAFRTLPYPPALREALWEAAQGDQGGSRALCCLNVLVGEAAVRSCRELCEEAGVDPRTLAFVGSHGQTLYHLPEPILFAGQPVRGTLQVGEGALIAEALGCPVVSDFRVRDMAAGGQGAPLVPYTDYLLYRREQETVALQNLGGIGNITILPGGAGPEGIIAFDTGPGNMIIDALMSTVSGGKEHYDRDGKTAGTGQVDGALLEYMKDQDRDYLRRSPPKSTGRETYNRAYTEALWKRAQDQGLPVRDIAATVTFYTAWTIRAGLERFCPSSPQELIISGGGAHNPTLLRFIRELLPRLGVYTADEKGINSDAKEAVAFAILANEALHGRSNNAPAATGAAHPVVMGKISL